MQYYFNKNIGYDGMKNGMAWFGILGNKALLCGSGPFRPLWLCGPSRLSWLFKGSRYIGIRPCCTLYRMVALSAYKKGLRRYIGYEALISK